MSFATLVFGRVKIPVATVTVDGESRQLTETEARRYHEEHVAAPVERAHAAALAQHQQKRDEFRRSLRVDTDVEVRRDTGGLRKTRMLVDQITVPGPPSPKVHEVDAGTADKFVAAMISKRCPAPEKPDIEPFQRWWTQNSKTKRTWRAQFISASAEEEISLPQDLGWGWGYPIAAAVGQLERLEAVGWTLLHVSEDRGLYAGADAADESYPTRVRYLLQRRDG